MHRGPDALLEYTKDILIRTSLDDTKMAVMGFDGASAMKSLARKLKPNLPQMLSTSIALLIAVN